MKTYNLSTKMPQTTVAKKEWSYKGLNLFLHRDGMFDRETNARIESEEWLVSEVSTGMTVANYSLSTMSKAIGQAHAKLDSYCRHLGTDDASPILTGKKIIN